VLKYDVVYKTGSTLRITTPLEDDRATTTGNMHKNLVKIGRAAFQLYVRTDRQTDAQTRQTNYNTMQPTARSNERSIIVRWQFPGVYR